MGEAHGLGGSMAPFGHAVPLLGELTFAMQSVSIVTNSRWCVKCVT